MAIASLLNSLLCVRHTQSTAENNVTINGRSLQRNAINGATDGSVAYPNPGSGAFLTPGSGMGKKQDQDPEMNNRELLTRFLG